MRLPRDVSGSDLAKALKALGYEVTRQAGKSPAFDFDVNGEHHVTIPRHNPLRIGTLAAILDEIAMHFGISRDDLLMKLNI
ncbi:MAG: type II toxin-antitoxin system HicA family toxin [Acidobacteria bacterium]|nr:type II toxin-antitoxin system HicA family toxin [Acidobacteriota bacterium]